MNLENNLDPKQTICRDLWSYPVVDLTKPRVRVCCKRNGETINEWKLEKYGKDVFLNLPNVIKDRQGLLNGEQVEGCKQCWELENKGQKSFRLGEMDFQYHFNNVEGEPIHWSKFRPFEKLVEEKETILYSDMPNKLDIQLGSYCDQKCVYCSWAYSTQWETEDHKFGRIEFEDPSTPRDIKHYKKYLDHKLDNWYETFLSWFDTIYFTLERIALLGGEPTFSPQFIPLTNHIIEKLKIKAHPNCTLNIVTNLNWKSNILNQIMYIRKELPNHIKLVLEISMESFEKRAEYIRFGIEWDRFVKNLKTISNLDNVEIKLCTTINGLCITSIQQYFEFIRTIEIENGKNFNVIANRLVYPKWLSTDLLDSSFSHYVENFITWLETTYIGDELNTKLELYHRMKEIHSELQLAKDKDMIGFFTKWIDAIDARRNINFLETFPEFSTLYKDHQSYGKRHFTITDLKQWQYWDNTYVISADGTKFL